MRLALHTTFTASRKEPLVEVVERIHAAIVAGGFGEPQIQFAFVDSPMGGGVSSVGRVLKRFPQLERFLLPNPIVPGRNESKVITNRSPSAVSESLDFAVLLEIARGVPRSFPFHGLSLQFSMPA